MATLTRSTELPLSADRAWSIVGRPESMSEWHPAIASSATDGNTRVCVLPDGARIHEEIRAHDDTSRAYTYVIVESPLPVKDYASTLEVKPLDGGRSLVTWSCSYEPMAPAAEVESLIAGVYEAGLGALAQDPGAAARGG